MSDIATTLATDFIRAQGWVCILVTAHDASRQSIVTIDGVDARDEPGSRLWLAQKHTDRIMTALLSRCEQARRRPRGAGLIVQAPVTATAQMIRGIADNFGYEVVGDELIDQQMAMISQRISDALPRVTKGLSKQYKAERASGVPVPAYDHWLVARLRPALVAGLG